MAGKGRNHVDMLVGQNIRLHRLDRGLSQTELAKHLGVTFQQVQKYENGVNRVGSGNLFKIASALSLPVTSLYDGADQVDQKSTHGSPVALLTEPYALRLLHAFSEIKDAELRKSIVEMAETFASKLKTAAGRKAKNGAGKVHPMPRR